MKIINLISGPRNISTALMYAFGQRADTAVFDEPFYALYLTKSGAQHPGADEVIRAQSADEQTVRNEVESSNGKPIAFVKNMAHHMEVMDQPFFNKGVNVFLIRDPKQIIASYAQVIQQPVMRDIGIEYQYTLFEDLKNDNKQFIVLDSGLLLENPESVLRQLCQRCEIPFDKAMLHWEKGPKPYDGVWAPHWYTNVHQSTGFQRQKTSDRELPEHLNTLYQQAKRYYEKLLPFSLKA